MRKPFFLLLTIAHFGLSGQLADLVIFSYNRPLQLYTLLYSIEQNMRGVGSQAVIYRASDSDFDQAYGQVKQRFKDVIFFKQGDRPAADFKLLTNVATFESKCAHVLFAVDDIIVKDFVDLSECIDCMESTQAYAFYLRLGEHLNYCYPCDAAQPVPPCVRVVDNIIAWQFKNGSYDWGYLHTVDMTIYRKSDIRQFFIFTDYTNPNELEALWAMEYSWVNNKFGLCYKDSKIVNLPLNRVQNVCENRSANAYTPHELLTAFNNGLMFDISSVRGMRNESAHVAFIPPFTARS